MFINLQSEGKLVGHWICGPSCVALKVGPETPDSGVKVRRTGERGKRLVPQTTWSKRTWRAQTELGTCLERVACIEHFVPKQKINLHVVERLHLPEGGLT